MAYDPSRMSLLGPASGGMLWSYHTSTDSAIQVKASNYFQSIWQQLDIGDRIHCHASGVFFDLAILNSISVNVNTLSSPNYS